MLGELVAPAILTSDLCLCSSSQQSSSGPSRAFAWNLEEQHRIFLPFVTSAVKLPLILSGMLNDKKFPSACRMACKKFCLSGAENPKPGLVRVTRLERVLT